MPLSKAKKAEYFTKMTNLLNTFSKVFVVEVNNVGSQQMNATRKQMRGIAEILMVGDCSGLLADLPLICN